MEQIIDPIDVALIKQELTPDKMLRHTNKGGNEIYVLDAHNAPNTMREIGRLREHAFRNAGGSTGLALDIDEFDTMEKPYQQLIVWDPDAEKILGGYRYIFGQDVTINENGQPNLASSHQFTFSQEFIEIYLPHVMELGRSFVTPEYQSSKAGAKALFALDNLWDGIAVLAYIHPQIFYFFGKMTIYRTYDNVAHDLLLHFLDKHFGDKRGLVKPTTPVTPASDPRMMDLILRDESFSDDYKNLKNAIHRLGTKIPPLVNSYMNTSPSMMVMGTSISPHMFNVEETAILVGLTDMYDDKKARHIESFTKDKVEEFKMRFPLLDDGFETKIVSRWDERRIKLENKFRSLLEKFNI